MCSSSGCRDKDHATGIMMCVNQCVLCLQHCMVPVGDDDIARFKHTACVGAVVC